MNYLVTGGAGFFGGVLKRRLLGDGHDVVSLDIEADTVGVTVRGDIRDRAVLDGLLDDHGPFDAVFHCAALLPHERHARDELSSVNVEGTRTLAETCRDHGIGRFVFLSSSCVFSRNFDAPVVESATPAPAEAYGRSKLAAERLLREFEGDMSVVVLRMPTIIDAGRLGLLAILFEFVEEGRRVWLVGSGANKYQFIDAEDLADACVRAAAHDRSALFHVGSDDVKPLREVFQHLVEQAGTGARVASLPKAPALLAMRLAHRLRMSPLGPYHYRMIASNFVFSTQRIRRDLGWRPTVTNEQMLVKAYDYYRARRPEIDARRTGPAHKRPADMGVIRLLKWLS